MNRIFWLAFFALALAPGLLLAQENGPTAAPVSPEDKDWLEFYYENPAPDKFVSEVKQWASDGTLKNETARPAIIAFLSQVFRQNRGKIVEWYEQLSSLSNEDRQILHTALLLSRTTEADALLQEQFGKKYEEQKQATSKILEMNLAQKNTLDMVWGFFYATGSKSAIRRIIWSFRFDDAPDNPDFATVPEGFRPLYKGLPDAAAWSLQSNALRHPKVLELCEDIYSTDKDLAAPEKRWLGDVLSAVDPKKYPKGQKP